MLPKAWLIVVETEILRNMLVFQSAKLHIVDVYNDWNNTLMFCNLSQV